MCSIRSLLPGTIGGLDRYIGRYIGWYIGRFSTDYRWTADRLSVDYRSTVGRLSVGRRPIVYRQSFRPIKSWTVDIRAIHDRQLTDGCSIHDRYFTDTSPTLDQYFSDTSPKLQRYLDQLFHDNRYKPGALMSNTITSKFRRKLCVWNHFKFSQEIIKVREWISHIGPPTRVIHLKLFLDMVPSSSANFTRAIFPKRTA